jgi:cellobiose phosphorylase
MDYGYFDDASREYVITNPRTPVKWINYIGTLDFGGFIDHTGGVLVCKKDPALNRITKYIPQLIASDPRGTTLYIRLHDEDGYRIFSPFYTPTLDKYDRFECHVGLGYSRFISEHDGIHTEITVFVPMSDERVLWDIHITNTRDTAVTLDAIPFVEYTHFDAMKQFNNADWVPQTMQSRAHWYQDKLVLSQYAFMKQGVGENFFTANVPVSSFETDRARFLGQHEYASWANPASLQEAELSNYEAHRGDNVAVLMIPVGSLASGETRRIITQLGQTTSIKDAMPAIEAYWQTENVDKAFGHMKAYWDNYLVTLQVETPDASMNSMLNVHHPRQCHTTKNWSRFLSLYQLGLGARGIGFRDSSQDVMGVLAHMADEGRELLEKLLSTQLRNGSAMHQFFPLTMEATQGEAGEDERPDYYGDDHLWIVLATCAYLRETGDMGFLDKVIPFYDKDKDGQPIENASVIDHLSRAIEFTRNDLGAHGLPLAGFADWNDTVNLPKGAESVFNAALYGVALLELIDLAKDLGLQHDAEKWAQYHHDMRESVNEHAWDGAWYVRYFDHEGQPIGSHTNETGQIFTNAQSWVIMADFAPEDRAKQALESVYTHLNTQQGIKLSAPGYRGYDPVIGGVSTYPPGAKENGGIFLHANPWVMIAETMMGNGDRAFQYYDQINPATKNDSIDVYECEPYVYAQNILGDEHPQAGLGRNSWLSGTASWVYQAATQNILGVYPTYNGLRIRPCVPQSWDSYKVTRKYRWATYEIEFTRTGTSSITLDGQAIEGDTLPIPSQEHHTVSVTF